MNSGCSPSGLACLANQTAIVGRATRQNQGLAKTLYRPGQSTHALGDRQEGDRQQHQASPAALHAEHQRDQSHHQTEVVHAVNQWILPNSTNPSASRPPAARPANCATG